MKKMGILIALMVSSLAWSQAEFEVSTSEDRMQIGDQVEITLEATVHINDDVVWPSFPGAVQFGSFIDRRGIDTSINGEEMTLREIWILTSFDSGFAVVAPLQLNVNGVFRSSEPQLIQVDLAGDGPEYRDIENPISPNTKEWILWMIVTTILLVAVGVLIRQYYKSPAHQGESNPTWANMSDAVISMLKDYKGKIASESNPIDTVLSDTSRLIQEYVLSTYYLQSAAGSPKDWDKELAAMDDYGAEPGQLAYLLEEVYRMRFSGASILPEEVNAFLDQVIEWVNASVVHKEKEADVVV